MKLDELPLKPRDGWLGSLWSACEVPLNEHYAVYIEIQKDKHSDPAVLQGHYWVQLRERKPMKRLRVWRALPPFEAQCLLYDLQNNLESYLKG